VLHGVDLLLLFFFFCGRQMQRVIVENKNLKFVAEVQLGI
jgi:uncharacterized membrane protein